MESLTNNLHNLENEINKQSSTNFNINSKFIFIYNIICIILMFCSLYYIHTLWGILGFMMSLYLLQKQDRILDYIQRLIMMYIF